MTASQRYFSISLTIVAGVLVATSILYPALPALVPTHWNVNGQVDGYSPKWALFVIVPAIMLATIGLFALLPWLSPRQFEVNTFRSTYLFIMLLTVAFLAYTQALLLAAAQMGRVDITRAIMGGVCLLVAMLGNVMGKVRRNFYIGIRTPWTLANEGVWNATHRFAARAFVISGLAGLISNFAGGGFRLTFALLMAGPAAAVVYSLIFYKQLQKREEL